MLTPKRDRVLREAIKRYGMSEEKFHFALGEGQMQIIYKPEGFYFRLVASRPPVPTSILYIYSTPDKSALTVDFKQEVYLIAESWDDAEVAFESWLDWIKEEYELSEDSFLRTTEKLSRKWVELADNLLVSDKMRKNMPSLTHLHPTIQQVANSLFASAHYPQAILAACTALDKAVQAKTQLPASTVGTALMTTAFSAKAPLIQLSQDTNEQMGFMNLYQGSVQAIRNHYAHNLTEIPAPRALEWLSFISALFYKLDESENIIKQ